MKQLRIAWAIFCAIIDIALVACVCIEWAKTGSPWWSLILVGVFYTVGAIAVWWMIDNVFQSAQDREDGDIYYGPQDE